MTSCIAQQDTELSSLAAKIQKSKQDALELKQKSEFQRLENDKLKLELAKVQDTDKRDAVLA